MPSVTITLDSDLEARVSRYADGIGLPLSEVVEKALVFALKTRFDAVDPDYGIEAGGGRPDNSLPGGRPDRPDNSLPGSQPGVDNELPGGAGRPDNTLPGGGYSCPVFDPEVDNELPEEEIPEEVPQPK